MDLMEFLEALLIDELFWNDDDLEGWIKEFSQLQDHNSPYVKALTEKLRKLEGDVLDLKRENEKHRWILVSERLPEDSGIVLVMGGSGWLELGCFTGKKWLRSSGSGLLTNHTHWKPIILPGK